MAYCWYSRSELISVTHKNRNITVSGLSVVPQAKSCFPNDASENGMHHEDFSSSPVPFCPIHGNHSPNIDAGGISEIKTKLLHLWQRQRFHRLATSEHKRQIDYNKYMSTAHGDFGDRQSISSSWFAVCKASHRIKLQLLKHSCLRMQLFQFICNCMAQIKAEANISLVIKTFPAIRL